MIEYLYNGIKLPQLPKWDKTAYPYAFIYTRNSSYLVLDNRIPVPNTDGTFGVFNSESVYESVNGEWVKTTLSNTGFTMIWSNTNILNSDGTVFLHASTPIPANGYFSYIHNGTWQKGTFYKRINNEWVKHQAYRRQNGVWVEVKE